MTRNPYKSCPTLDSRYFTYRLVKEEDATDLLACYSDIKSVPIFNSDNCNCDFHFKTESEMKDIIKFWLMEYSESGYVRFTIIDNYTKKAIGSIEIFAKKELFETYNKVGLLRVDLASDYEKSNYLLDIFEMCKRNFADLFDIDSIATKITPAASVRRSVLSSNGYTPLLDTSIINFDDYYIIKL